MAVDLERLYGERGRSSRLRRWLTPPDPLIPNPREPKDFPLGRWNLYIGGAGRAVAGYVNLDLFAVPGVDVQADAERLPFPPAIFQRIECDAVLEHVRSPAERHGRDDARARSRRLSSSGHAFLSSLPRISKRLSPLFSGWLEGTGGPELEVVAEGWRTGPTATMLVFSIEYVKLWFPWRWWRVVAHGVLGWVLFPLRYLDLLFLNTPRAGRIGNHCYLWLRKVK